jgi:nucleotide-binding universal stress UspA family protein
VETILVPVDFSRASRRAFARARELAERRIVLLHVMETGALGRAAIDRMRRAAERELARLEKAARNRVEIELVIARGEPFVEIVKAAEDYDVDGIVIGR